MSQQHRGGGYIASGDRARERNRRGRGRGDRARGGFRGRGPRTERGRGRVGPFGGICYRCGEIGHKRSECYLPVGGGAYGGRNSRRGICSGVPIGDHMNKEILEILASERSEEEVKRAEPERENKERTNALMLLQQDLFVMTVTTAFRKLEEERIWDIDQSVLERFNGKSLYEVALRENIPWRQWNHWVREKIVTHLRDNNRIANPQQFGGAAHEHMQIFLQRDGHSTVSLKMTPHASVADIKGIICDKWGTPPEKSQWLATSGGKPLVKESLSLQDYGVRHNDTLTFSVFSATQNSVTIESLIGKFTFDVGEFLTVEGLKMRIEEVMHICWPFQRISDNDRVLRDSECLFDENNAKRTLQLSFDDQCTKDYTHKQKGIITDLSLSADRRKAKLLSLSNVPSSMSIPFRQEISAVSSVHALREMSTRMTKALHENSRATEDRIQQIVKRCLIRFESSNAQFKSNFRDILNCCDSQITLFRQDVDTFNAEIDVLKDQIEALQRKKDQLEARRDATNTLCNETVLAIRANITSKNSQQEQLLNAKAESIASECERMESINQEKELAEVILQKQRELEKQYTSWTVDDVIAWIKLMNDGYFNDKKFEVFFEALQRMKINGKNVDELNSGLFLKMIGLSNEEEQLMLRREINRMIMHQNDTCYQSICGACAGSTINTVIIPCGHQYFCAECAKISGCMQCPICRGNVSNIVNTYLSGFTKSRS